MLIEFYIQTILFSLHQFLKYLSFTKIAVFWDAARYTLVYRSNQDDIFVYRVPNRRPVDYKAWMLVVKKQ